VRETWNTHPSRVFANGLPVKKCVNMMYNGRQFALQRLDAPETVQSDKEVCFTLVRFFPARMEFGPREEIIVPENTPVSEITRRLGDQHKIGSVGFYKPWSSDSFNVLVAMEKDWEKSVKNGEVVASHWNGDTAFYRDTDEPAKTLDRTEREAIKKKVQISASSSSGWGKEKALFINTDN